MESIALIFFISYALMSVAYQIESPLKGWLSRHDRLGLIPSWTFFAPIPGTSDYRVVFRDFCESDICSSWAEIDLYSTRRFFRWIWHPAKHRQKCITDTIQFLMTELGRRHSDDSDDGIILSWGYLQLLRLVNESPRSDESTFRQFAIVSTKGFKEPRNMNVVYISRRHRL